MNQIKGNLFLNAENQKRLKISSIGQGLHLKVMLFSGLIILVTVCTCTLIYIHRFKVNYLEAIEWRSRTLAQSIRIHVRSRYSDFGKLTDLNLLLESAYLECRKLYDANSHMHVSFVCILDRSGTIIIHNDKKMWKKQMPLPGLDSVVQKKEDATILSGDVYHTLIPVESEDNRLLGIVDVGFPKSVVDEKVMDGVRYAVNMFFILFVAAFLVSWFFVRRVVVQPVNALIQATSAFANGDLTRDISVPRTKEFLDLALSLTRMRDAIRQNMLDIEEKNQQVKAMVACSPLALFSIDKSRKVTIWTESARSLFGWEAEQVTNKVLPTVFEEDGPVFEDLCKRAFDGEKIMGYELRQKTKDGAVFFSSLSLAPIYDADKAIVGIMGTTEDITRRIEREKEHAKVREELLQAQKMESVGRLAGGVAHDYNNTLGVILGYSELLLDRFHPEDPMGDDVQKIIKATLHSADITRQLLTFARKQTISPKVIDLNRQVGDMLKMLQRLIGENFELEWLPDPTLGFVKMDPVQVDQVLANLCINARDAMGNQGKIIIRTRSAQLDEDYCMEHPEFMPGEFICLEVSDTGSGIEKSLLKKIFDPFFTTKKKGEGTGLGLSTVYGIVKQNQGFINVYSEPGKGTTFKIYFSWYKGSEVQYQASFSDHVTEGSGEIILLVEDEAELLTINRQVLESLGYQVICAQSPDEALDLVENKNTAFDLLITDVILPEMNGLELSRRIEKTVPDLKVLFTSGYTANVIAHQGILDEDVHFIQKPFSKRDLAAKVVQVLES